MTRSGLTRLLIVGIAGLVVALSLAAVRSTDALWSDRATATSTTATTGQLKLVAGGGTGSTYQFPGLAGTGQLPGQQSQAPLVITNGGTTPLRYRLTAAGPQITSGSAVTVTLSGAVGGTCTTGPLSGTSAFTTVDASAAGTAVVGGWRSLAKNASETWCIRSALKAVSGTGSSTYSILFTFGTEQTRS